MEAFYASTKEYQRKMKHKKIFENFIYTLIHTNRDQNGIPCTFIQKEGNNTICYDRLMTFQSDITKKNYVLFTDNTFTKNGNLAVYGGIFDPNAEKPEKTIIFLDPDNCQDWKICREMVARWNDNKNKAEKSLEDFLVFLSSLRSRDMITATDLYKNKETLSEVKQACKKLSADLLKTIGNEQKSTENLYYATKIYLIQSMKENIIKVNIDMLSFIIHILREYFLSQKN